MINAFSGWRLIRMALWILAAGVSLNLQAGQTYKFATGETTGYLDDPARWTGDSGGDRHSSAAGTITATNGVHVDWWQFEFGSTDSAHPTRLKIESGAYVGYDNRPGNNAGTYGIVDVDAGGTFNGAAWVGVSGFGIVTNNGTFRKSEQMHLGVNATGHGIFVHNGTLSNVYPKNMFIGQKGWGELIINAPFSWAYNIANDGDVVVGQASQADNRIVINEDGTFRVLFTYVGGRRGYEGEAGRGTLHLRGGTYINCYDTNGNNNLFLGTATNETGEISADTCGIIRGWGLFKGDDNSSSRSGWRGVHAQLGRGEIVADGEGDESRVLETGAGLCYVTNVLFGTLTTSGWRAVNKGMVTLSRGQAFNGNVLTTNQCVGCAWNLAKPDLVNAVRVSGTYLSPGSEKSFGAAVLAPDRTDAHTNALPKATAAVLGVWRIGLFGTLSGNMDKKSLSSFKVDFRYDQTRLTGSTVSRLDIMRYTAASGRWTYIGGTTWGERPDDCILSIPNYLSANDTASETYNLGTFAVIERFRKATTVFVR